MIENESNIMPCIFCQELINSKAKKCIHCGEFLDRHLLMGKPLWDWLGLFIVPLTLIILGFLLSNYENRRQNNIEKNRENANYLQNYLDDMSNIILAEDLTDANVMAIIQARTMTTISILDGKRNQSLIRFLREAKLLDRIFISANLQDVDLSGVNLKGVSLYQANLSHANLSGANLQGAYLCNTILWEADLSNATFFGTNLSSADLSDANLTNTNLMNTTLSNGVDLHGAIFDKTRFNGAIHDGTILWSENIDVEGAEKDMVREETISKGTLQQRKQCTVEQE